MSTPADHLVVEIHSDGSVVVDGARIDSSQHADPYAEAFGLLGAEARRRGDRVLTRGIDHTIGEDTWFYVSESGETQDAAAPPAGSARPDPAQSDPAHSDPAQLPSEAPLTAAQTVSPTGTAPAMPQTAPATPPVPPALGASSEPSAAQPAPPAPAGPFEPAVAPAPSAQPAPRPSRRAEPTGDSRPSSEEPHQRTRSSRRTEPTSFVKPTKARPVGGVRGMLYTLSGGSVNLGPSARQQDEDALERRIARQLPGAFNTAILSLKGGIGKTSTTVGVGMTLAEYRGDPPCAIDANPDSGDLAERALGESIYQSSSPRTVSDIIGDLDSITSLTELSRYMKHAGRFHVLAGEQDPEVSDSLTAEEYLKIRTLIGKYYSVLLTDCGTGVTHNAMSGILQSADNLVIAAGYAVSGAKRARSTLLWLANHGYEKLAREAIVVVTDKDGVSSRVNKAAIEEHLTGMCRELIAVPHDQGVADGDLISLEALRPATRRAYKQLAAAIVDGYR